MIFSSKIEKLFCQRIDPSRGVLLWVPKIVWIKVLLLEILPFLFWNNRSQGNSE